MQDDVLVVSRELLPFTFGGFARLLYEYLKRGSLFRYLVLTWYDRDRKDEDRIRFIQVKYPPFFLGSRYLRAVWFVLAGFLKCFRQDFSVVVGAGLNGSLLAVILGLAKNRPRVSIVYDVDLIKKETGAYGFMGRASRRLALGLIFRFSDKVMCGSSRTKKEMVDLFRMDPDKITVNPPGVEPPKNIPLLKDVPCGSEIMLLFVSSLSPKEGLEFIIDAMALLAQDIAQFKLYIVGKEVYRDYALHLKQKVKDLRLEEHIIFTGRVEDAWSHYRACDIFVAASYNQKGFSMPVIEASSIGKPVVATRYLEEVGVVRDGVNGLVVPDKDPTALRDAIKRLIQDKDLMYRLGEEGKEYVKRFDWNISTEIFERDIARVLS